MWHNILANYQIVLTILALIGIEISPIKFNPISYLGKICGKLLGIEKLGEKIDRVNNKVDENERDRIRYEILQFSGSLRNGIERTENDYTHIEELYQKYHEKLKANSYISSEMVFIRECRNKTLEK